MEKRQKKFDKRNLTGRNLNNGNWKEKSFEISKRDKVIERKKEQEENNRN